MAADYNPPETGAESVQAVRTLGLCVMCGVCAGVCPSGCIVMERDALGQLVPNVAPSGYTRCGLCRRVCPGQDVDLGALARRFLPETAEHPLLGRYRHCYIGETAEDRIRAEATSGGVATALVLFAMRRGLARRALLTRMHPSDPLVPQAVVAESEADVLRATGSKYAPVAYGHALREAMAGDGRFVVVGLPCHVHGLRKAQTACAVLGDRALVIGLFCGYGKTFRVTETALSRRGIVPSAVKRIVYRADGWPGVMWVELRAGDVVRIPFAEWFRREFSPRRCTLCCDGAAELADVACDDAWLPEYRGRSRGLSVLVARSETGARLVAEAAASGVLSLTEVSADKVVASQRAMLTRKKVLISAHMNLYRRFGIPVPDYHRTFRRARIREYLAASALWVRIAAAQRPAFNAMSDVVASAKRFRARRPQPRAVPMP
jgi:coenzyme F420 hydrogenase subunit beta